MDFETQIRRVARNQPLTSQNNVPVKAGLRRNTVSYCQRGFFVWNNGGCYERQPEEKCSETELAFSGEQCTWHFSRALFAAGLECEAHMFSAAKASYYILLCEMERTFYKQHFVVCQSHTRPHSLFSPVELPSDNVLSIVRPQNKLLPHALKKV